MVTIEIKAEDDYFTATLTVVKNDEIYCRITIEKKFTTALAAEREAEIFKKHLELKGG